MTAICMYLGNLQNKCVGVTNVEKSLVDQWISFTNTSLMPPIETINKGIFGTAEVAAHDWNEALKQLKGHVKTLDAALAKKKWVSGDEISIADVCLAMTLLRPLQTVLDGGFRKAMKNFSKWVNEVFAQTCITHACGTIHLAEKALKPIVAAEKK